MSELPDWTTALITQKERLKIGDGELEQLFWQFYPRYRFLKTLPMDASLLDIGAGSGGLSFWSEWGHPRRKDIFFFGVDLQHGQHAGRYADWRVANLDEGLPDFGHPFQGFLASHLIEHVASPAGLIEAMRRQAAPRARVYLEWPHPRSAGFPKAADLGAQGFVMQTFNFFDDFTHLRTPERREVEDLLSARGFHIVESGEVTLGPVAEEYMARGRRRNDMVWRQMGLWAATGWCNYVIGQLPE